MPLLKISPGPCPQPGNPTAHQAAPSDGEEKRVCAQEGWGRGHLCHPAVIADDPLLTGAFGGDALLLLAQKPKIHQAEGNCMKV